MMKNKIKMNNFTNGTPYESKTIYSNDNIECNFYLPSNSPSNFLNCPCRLSYQRKRFHQINPNFCSDLNPTGKSTQVRVKTQGGLVVTVHSHERLDQSILGGVDIQPSRITG